MSTLQTVWIVFQGLTPGWVYLDKLDADLEVRNWRGQRTAEQFIPAARLRELVEKWRAQSIGYLNALDELEALLAEGEGE